MPHLIIEVPSSLLDETVNVLPKLNQILIDTGHFKAVDIKSRIVPSAYSLVGTGEECQHFIALQLLIMSGRSLDVRQSFADVLLNGLKQHFADYPAMQCTVEVLELSQVYAKTTI